jgi:hypothetical protein
MTRQQRSHRSRLATMHIINEWHQQEEMELAKKKKADDEFNELLKLLGGIRHAENS